MHNNTINDLYEFINEQSYQREELAVYLRQSAALIKMALSQCFQEQEDQEQHDYLWAVSNLLDSAKDQNDPVATSRSKCLSTTITHRKSSQGETL